MSERQTVIRTLIVEDEPQMIRYMSEMLLDETKRVVIVGEACSGREGVDMIRTLRPDLVFLDVQMPELDAFDLIREVGIENMPMFVFVTAHTEYALRAFEVEAVDYLCKPFDRDRLLVSLERAIRHIRIRNSSSGVNVPTNHGQWLSRLAINEEHGLTFVSTDDIVWIEAANKYVVIHTPRGRHIARETMQYLEERLDPKHFVRIHRSVLVRKNAIRALHPLFHGDYTVKLESGQELRLSRHFRETFFEQMSR